MTEFDFLRLKFNEIMEEQWETVKLAERLYPQIVTLGYWDVDRAVRTLLGTSRPRVEVHILDHRFRTYPRTIFEEVIADDNTDRSMPWPDWNDCDDRGWLFKAFMALYYNVTAVGFVKDDSSGHAYNLVVLPGAPAVAVLFEPQQDRFVELDEPIDIPGGIALPAGSTGRYSLTGGLILI